MAATLGFSLQQPPVGHLDGAFPGLAIELHRGFAPLPLEHLAALCGLVASLQRVPEILIHLLPPQAVPTRHAVRVAVRAALPAVAQPGIGASHQHEADKILHVRRQHARRHERLAVLNAREAEKERQIGQRRLPSRGLLVAACRPHPRCAVRLRVRPDLPAGARRRRRQVHRAPRHL